MGYRERAAARAAELTREEKLAVVSGDAPFWAGLRDLLREDGYHRHPWSAGVLPRRGIEGLRFVDGPRGVVLEGGATTFPVPMARAASFDPELEERIGEAIGREVRAVGANLFGGVCVNLLRHPGWGRAQETYGEDPVLLGAFGAALARGVQRHAMACVKHFAMNSIEESRFSVDVRASKRVLHELYLPHFREVVASGVAAVMSAYNAVNGEWCGQSPELLRRTLKERWGFEGFVLSDFVFGLRDAAEAMNAGQDLEMPFRMHFWHHLPRALRTGRVPEARLDDAVRRILAQQLRFAECPPPEPGVLGCAAHRALAREAAARSMVLLKNEGPLLPLEGGERLAVLGRLAATPNLGDRGSSDTRPLEVATPLQGLEEALPEPGRVRYAEGDDLEAARERACAADVALVVVGCTYRDEGEGVVPAAFAPFADGIPPPAPFDRLLGAAPLRALWRGLVRLGDRRTRRRRAVRGFGRGSDRRELGLSERDAALVRAVAEVQPRTVVALMAGSAVLMEPWRHEVPAILMLWYPGMEGGRALADVLLGRAAPEGRMPFATPTDAAHLPRFEPDADEVDYDLWHGYRKLERDGVDPAFPFGFGLGYTRFALEELRLARDAVGSEESVEAEVRVRNAGERDGAEVVQLYAAPPDAGVERPAQELRAFARVAVPAGESRPLRLRFPAARLARFDEAKDDFVVAPGVYELRAARYAGDPEALRARLRVRASR